MPKPFFMPAEWADHERSWMAWPCRDGMWADAVQTKRQYAAVAHAIRDSEPVTMVVPPRLADEAANFLGSDIELLAIPINDSWARDSGPNFVVNDDGERAGVCFRFNAWGEKYAPYDEDARMAERILADCGVPAIHSPLIAEGGGLCVDGEGTLLTTTTCFPNPNRNPEWSRDEIEAELKTQLGVSTVLWLPGDPLDDETDGHIDGIAAFSQPGSIIIESTQDKHDPRKPFFDELRSVLENSEDAKGRAFRLLELPEASPDLAVGDRFCLSYVNFYVANRAVIAPAYGVKMDAEVKERLQSYFPTREIVQVRIEHIAEGGGGIHCITQQQPKGR
ncbi:MAG: agmatine deiminase family protein [Congregibacter sp.]